ncbi:hypothetical protein [uncultured Anaerococcus sp.]|uniref:hypothetical protein n=1 Tax=uncultured Anaerococcus sp. TaxID=293428 RepID=UPI0025FA4B65|nr:hypothetical protein [uncultured Anaerococcus sp.]
MNRKIIASLLSLGLILSPISGSGVTLSHATEQASQDNNIEYKNEKNRLEGYLYYYEQTKKSDEYRLASSDSRKKLDNAMNNAREYISEDELKKEDLKAHILEIEKANKDLVNSKEENIKNLKNNIIKGEKLLANNEGKKDSDQYKNLSKQIEVSSENLKNKVDGDTLTGNTVKLAELFDQAKDSFEDENVYDEISKEDLENLKSETNGKEESKASEDSKKVENLEADIKILVNGHRDFMGSEKFKTAEEDSKKRYTDAIEAFEDLGNIEISEENYDKILLPLTKIAETRLDIEGEKLDLKAVKYKDEELSSDKKDPSSDSDKIIKTLKNIGSLIENLNRTKISDNRLNKKYNNLHGRALALQTDHANGLVRNLEEYQKVETELKGLREETRKSEESKDDSFKDTKAAKDAVNKKLNDTSYIDIKNIYGDDKKDARKAYEEARAKASDLVKKEDASLEDLSEAYGVLNKAIEDLAGFLHGRLKQVIDEDEEFRKSEDFKGAKEEARENYDKLLEKAKEENEKDEADANELDILYKKLLNSKDEIKRDLSSDKRKLADIIDEAKYFINTEAYQKSAVSSDKWQNKASENYKKLLTLAENLKSQENPDTSLVEEVLDAMTHAKDFMEAGISETKYKNNYYYYLLKAIEAHEDYKDLGQTSKQRLTDALKMYTDGEEDDEKILAAFEEALNDSAIKKIKEKIEKDKNPNEIRDKLLEDLTELIDQDKNLRESGFKYQKAQKSLRDAYDLAFKEAKELLENTKSSEEEVRAAYKKLLNAKNNLDGDKFSELRDELAARFKKDQAKIAKVEDREAIAEKINALQKSEATMDDALKVEKELEDLINKPKTATSTTLTPQGGETTTTRPVSTITNPGSSVKTGINGIAKVAAVLAVAAIILIFMRKKGEENENN